MKNLLMTIGGILTLSLAIVAVLENNQPVFSYYKDAMIQEIDQMSVPRAVHQATLLQTGEVLITGGCTGFCNGVQSSVEIYNPDSKTFRTVASMSEPRSAHTAVSLNDGRVFVAGGWNGRGSNATATAEIFDPITEQWSSVGSMADARMNLFAATLPDGRILIGGGGYNNRNQLDSAEIFDPATATFSRTSSMNVPRDLAVATTLEDGRVLISGGHHSGQKHRSTEIFDPATETFQTAGNMDFPRDRHAAQLLQNGTVLVIGGQMPGRDKMDKYTSTEIYNPSTDRFTTGPAMQWGRHKIVDAVAMLKSGAVLLAGGSQQQEIWKPGEKVFRPIQVEMYGRHEFATATLLDSGDVLVLGGYAVLPEKRSASAWLVREVD